jgi:hypothetical protein
MFAAKEGRSNLGIPPSVGSDFVASLIGHPGAVKALPAKAKSSKAVAPKKAAVPKGKGKTIHVHVHLNGYNDE